MYTKFIKQPNPNNTILSILFLSSIIEINRIRELKVFPNLFLKYKNER